MARYTGPACRLCRREGEKLYLKGERCYSDKCAVDKRKTAPGQHGNVRSKMSDFGIQLRQKQRLKRIYNVLEAPFRRIFQIAVQAKGKTGEALIQNLELRLDNIVYRSGFASSRRASRQLVRHNHILLNGKRCNMPSCVLKPTDVVSVVESSKSIPAVLASTESCKRDGHGVPAWLKADHVAMTCQVLAVPPREDIHIPVREQLVVELYSK